MKNTFTIISLFLTITVCAQTTHDVTVQNFSFSPQSVTITVGDIVKWTNISGTHNVRANDNSFNSGPAAPAPWVFTHTFTAVGSYPYFCEPHQGMGMTGTIIVQEPVSVDDDNLVADKFKLLQNFPNPFNPTTKIEYQILERSFVSLKVYNILGYEVASLVNEEKPTGVYNVNFDASGLSSGMYLYRLQAGSFVETKKMSLIK
jgi:plastocyanin